MGGHAGLSQRPIHLVVRGVTRILLGLGFIAGASCATFGGYVNFEGKQTNPLRLSPDGSRLFAVNTPDARLSVFDVTQPSNPRLVAEMTVLPETLSTNPSDKPAGAAAQLHSANEFRPAAAAAGQFDR